MPLSAASALPLPATAIAAATVSHGCFMMNLVVGRDQIVRIAPV
jgi:hypothetical protein